MQSYRLRSIDELAAIHDGHVKLAGADLGVESFGMQVLDFPAGFSHYPEHDHSEDGQEEVYVILDGSAELTLDGEPVTVRAGDMLWVAPGTRRMLTPGGDGVRVLAVGCTTGGAYRRPQGFQLAGRS